MLSELSVEEGAFSFQAPVATVDLRFAFGDLAPVYRWRLKVEPTEGEFDLGTLDLVAGSSVAGWIRDRDSDLPVERAKVTLALLTSDDDQPTSGPVYQTHSDLHGFFQARGVTSGRYRLQASDKRMATLVLDEIKVVSESETLLGALYLTPPLETRIHIEPSVAPDGGRWQLHLRPSRPLSEEAAIEAEVGKSGIAELRGLRPTEYVVEVKASSSTVFLAEKHDIRTDSVLELSVPVIGVRGVVRFDDEPLEARIVLQTGASDSAELESDPEGEFQGLIRRPRWSFLLATISWLDGSAEKSANLELYPELPDEGDLELDIEIPNQSVSGTVVDGEGAPVPAATVIASPARPGLARIAKAQTNDAGGFHISGLGEELYLVRAKRVGAGASEVSRVDLGSGLGTSEIRLVLTPSRIFEGRVLTSEGEGLSNVLIDFMTRGRSPVSTYAVSDWSGAFSVDLPEDARDAVIAVFAPSQLLWSECVRLDAREEMVIRLPPLPGGTLLLETRGRPDLPPATGGQLVVVSRQGGVFRFGVLRNWLRRMNAETQYDPETGIQIMTVPAVAPGDYSLIRSPRQVWELADAACSGAFLGQEGGTLVAGGQAHLSFDVSKYQERLRPDAGSE
ncbi:MAG: carboxypeptidase regulatory-like domain-containing protein [bacterium]|nr:carboxypeptidase regulatory-like domain-containing protein [bacterium]